MTYIYFSKNGIRRISVKFDLDSYIWMSLYIQIFIHSLCNYVSSEGMIPVQQPVPQKHFDPFGFKPESP